MLPAAFVAASRGAENVLLPLMSIAPTLIVQRGVPSVLKTAIAFDVSSATRMMLAPFAALPALIPSDDGSLTGRGRPVIRGFVCGLMTALGGLGHTLPYLIPDFTTATAVAIAVVAIELIAIAYIRHHYMDTPLTSAIFQVVVGGVLVFITGILIGSS